jgi:hypothetical protein
MGGAHFIKHKQTIMMMIIVIIVVPCPSSSSLIVGLDCLCPFMGAGCHLWPVVGGGSRFCSFLRVHCCFRAFVLVFRQSSSIVVCWGRHGGSADIGHGCCVLFVAMVSLVLVEENKSHHKL